MSFHLKSLRNFAFNMIMPFVAWRHCERVLLLLLFSVCVRDAKLRLYVFFLMREKYKMRVQNMLNIFKEVCWHS